MPDGDEPDFDEPFLDVDAASYVPLETAIADPFRARHLNRFFAVSELSTTHYGEAADMLRLDRGVAPDGTLVLRVEFPFMGATSWFEWGGTLDEALEIATELGERQGFDVGYDQAHGPTGWESEFDSELTTPRPSAPDERTPRTRKRSPRDTDRRRDAVGPIDLIPHYTVLGRLKRWLTRRSRA